MKRIKFNVNYRKDIEEGKLLVITRNDLPVNIFDWELGLGEYPIVGQIKEHDGTFTWSDYTEEGISRDGSNLDLFLIDNG